MLYFKLVQSGYILWNVFFVVDTRIFSCNNDHYLSRHSYYHLHNILCVQFQNFLQYNLRYFLCSLLFKQNNFHNQFKFNVLPPWKSKFTDPMHETPWFDQSQQIELWMRTSQICGHHKLSNNLTFFNCIQYTKNTSPNKQTKHSILNI